MRARVWMPISSQTALLITFHSTRISSRRWQGCLIICVRVFMGGPMSRAGDSSSSCTVAHQTTGKSDDRVRQPPSPQFSCQETTKKLAAPVINTGLRPVCYPSSTHPTHTLLLHIPLTLASSPTQHTLIYYRASSTSTQHTHTLPQQTQLHRINTQQHVRTWFVSQVLPLLSDQPSFFADLLTWSQHLVEV